MLETDTYGSSNMEKFTSVCGETNDEPQSYPRDSNKIRILLLVCKIIISLDNNYFFNDVIN